MNSTDNLRAMLARTLAALETPGDLTDEERTHVIADAGRLLHGLEEQSTARTKVPLYRALAGAILARHNCVKSGNGEWQVRHFERIEDLAKLHLPHGSGLDGEVSVDVESSNATRIVIHTEFHHMNADGYYDGWTKHDVIVKASLVFGIEVRITGPDRNGIKDYLTDTFRTALEAEVDEYPVNTGN